MLFWNGFGRALGTNLDALWTILAGFWWFLKDRILRSKLEAQKGRLGTRGGSRGMGPAALILLVVQSIVDIMDH